MEQRLSPETGRCGLRWSRRAVLVAGLALAGCGGPERPSIRESGNPSTGEPTTQALQGILNRRAKALTAGDEKGFLADLDPSNDKMIQQQKLVFANLRQFKLSTFKYISQQVFSPRQDGELYVFAPIHEVAQLTADEGPGGVSPAGSFRYSVARRDGKLVIVGIDPIGTKKDDPGGGLPPHAPWYLTPLKVTYAGAVCLVGDDTATDLDRYAAGAQSELRHVESLWGDRPRFPGHVLFFTRDDGNFAKWFSVGKASNFQPTVEGYQIAQQGVRQNGDIYNGQYAGARIVVNLRAIDLFGDDPRRVIRHELAHAVTSRTVTVSPGGWVLGAPRWAREGFARWVEGIDERGTVAAGVSGGKFRGKLPTSKDFYGDDITFNYAVSSTAFRYVERTKGKEAAVELYASVIQYNDTEGQPVAEAPIFNAICKRVLGVESKTFTQQWASFVRSGA